MAQQQITQEEIYDHLAKVYLDKKQKQNTPPPPPKKKFPFQKTIQVFGLLSLLAIVFYGFSAFLSKKVTTAQSVIFALNHNPIRIKYNLNPPFPAIEIFSMNVPLIDASKYRYINFMVRGLEEGYPGVIKVTVRNKRNEVSSYLIQDIKLKWKKVSIPVAEFKEISDWSNLQDISFVLEAWNAEKKKGIVLIDDISFSS